MVDSTSGVRRAFWICAGITIVNAAVSAGFSLAALTGGGFDDPLGLYAASRSIALLIVVLAVVVLRSRQGLTAVAFAMGLVQLFDTYVGFRLHDPGKTYGPLFFAIATFAAASMLSARSSSSP